MWIGWGKAVDPISRRQLVSAAKPVGQACEKAVGQSVRWTWASRFRKRPESITKIPAKAVNFNLLRWDQKASNSITATYDCYQYLARSVNRNPARSLSAGPMSIAVASEPCWLQAVATPHSGRPRTFRHCLEPRWNASALWMSL